MAARTSFSTISTSQSEVDDLVLDLDPLQGMWTEAQYLRLTEQTNRLVEFTNGTIEVLPVPTRTHQLILAFFYRAMLVLTQSTNGIVLFAPLRVQVAPGHFREPDLVVLLDQHDPRNQDRYWLGADLVLEVVSPDKPERDLIEKRRDYAEAGIPEYWIVNPIDETVTVLTLEGDRYAEHGVFARGTTATSMLLENFAVNVDAVFDAA